MLGETFVLNLCEPDHPIVNVRVVVGIRQSFSAFTVHLPLQQMFQNSARIALYVKAHKVGMLQNFIRFSKVSFALALMGWYASLL